MNFVPIPTTQEHLNAWAEHWLPFLPGIARRSKEPIADILGKIARHEIQVALVWDGKQAHAFVGISYHRRGNDLIAEILYLTGNGMKQWRHLLADLERYLREHVGVAEIRPICRPGWAPFLKKHGYRITHYTMEKVL